MRAKEKTIYIHTYRQPIAILRQLYDKISITFPFPFPFARPHHGSQLHTCSQFSTSIDSSSIRRNLIMISIFFVPISGRKKEKLDSLLDYLRKLYHMIMWVRSYHAIKFFKTHIKIAIANEGFLCRWCVLCT